MSLLGFLLQLEQCPVKLFSGDDPTKAESCFRIFTISEIALRVPIPSCRRDLRIRNLEVLVPYTLATNCIEYHRTDVGT